MRNLSRSYPPIDGAGSDTSDLRRFLDLERRTDLIVICLHHHLSNQNIYNMQCYCAQEYCSVCYGVLCYKCMKKHKTQRDAASTAVSDLRLAMGMTQQRFAVEVLKTAITTVARYETTHPPRGDALLRLAKIAAQNDLLDLAARFRRLHLDEVLSGLHFNLLVDEQTKTGWLVMKLNGQPQIDDAIDFFEKYRTRSNDDPSWLAWKQHVGYRGKRRKRQ